MPNSKTSEASHVSKARRVTLKKYKILNGDKTQNSRKNLKTQAKNSRIRHLFVPYMPKKWPKNKPGLASTAIWGSRFPQNRTFWPGITPLDHCCLLAEVDAD